MSHDNPRGRRSSQRRVERPRVAPRALADLKELLYRLYTEAGAPTLEHIATLIADDDALPGCPSKDTVQRIISSPELPPRCHDAVAVAGVLAREAGWDVADAMSMVSKAWTEAHLEDPLGSPVEKLEPLSLEVHRAITLGNCESLPDLPALPAYVERDHDRRLRDIVDSAVAGASRMVTLVGGSSTGKTRACWEAVRRLPKGWRVWHPYDPTRPVAALEGIARVGPRTVIWLNEAQYYLLTPDSDDAERIAAGLRTALHERHRGPVLVLAALWPQHWERLTTRPAADRADPYAQQRELLTGVGEQLTLPTAFSEADLKAAQDKSVHDPRLRQALDGATGGEITQFLAGVPELLARYHAAPPGASALIKAAMDYRRLGHSLALPLGLLEHAADDYFTDREFHELGGDWLDAALDYCAAPCKGVPGPLVPMRRRTRERDATPVYRLADYLEQHGRVTRHTFCPPASFWEAAADHVGRSEDRHALADAARQRGRYRHAADLYAPLAEQGDTAAMVKLARLRQTAGAPQEAEALYRTAAEAGDPAALVELARAHLVEGDLHQAERLARDAAEAGDATALLELARAQELADEPHTAEHLARTAAPYSTDALLELARLRQRSRDFSAVERLARAAVDAGDNYAYTLLALMRQLTGDSREAERLARTAADHGDTSALIELAETRELAGDTVGAEDLARTAADAGNIAALIELAEIRGQSGDLDEAERLYWDVAKRGESHALVELAELLLLAGNPEEAEHLARTAAAGMDTAALAFLTRIMERDGYPDEAEGLARTAADAGDTSALLDLARKRAGNRPRDAERLARAAIEAAIEAGDSYALAFLARLRERHNDPEGAEHMARAAAGAGDIQALVELSRVREQKGDLKAAERLARIAADAGDLRALTDLAHRLEQTEASPWTRFRHYGLDPDGRIADPW
ncbi:transcriptional regulator [Streptomyces sp. HC44]|uniref:Transcriptional regulator n=1 Tax=Streptomyces scabichelini TaxID=2711217 RepID=A0A6G4V8A4_9ACTN|nr:transcriptional regulator [Streptomyces scabichelini]NGO10067.1 transcriptional regulator [Streptomyces scabichelini]